ncbi:TRAP transporter small permease [Roseospira marina]|uniref:TRAP transporter small permease protein n=1 Tax=Roseospira marina TaxID=140057 RepID=A0A5M6ICD6_9PROT|nr:TRAP transporter small permease [Roseospira marina]KAA5605873.1 TRAP transporter small permease [Roseospira marina]MBB4313693.1 TRAP-type C4-dicarboxylate transport system permease small subunit [Roseospira marina]MBB5086855.1 TRAP-type C4-dicarboxylate transport system permease small subunit [Roseospira marina]
MDAFLAAVKAVSRACGVTAALLVATSVLVVCHMVVLRYLLNESTLWQTDFVTYALVAATFVGCPYVLMLRGHVNVDLIPLFLPHRGRIALALLAALIGLLFCGVLAWKGFTLTLEAYHEDWRSASVWKARLWIPYAAIPVGLGLTCLQYVADVLALLTGRDLPFGMQPHER